MTRSDAKKDAPRSDEFELSLFGPGYGECAVVHCGSGEWIVVDSLIDRAVSMPVALAYLASIGVEPEAAVKVIVASHWHEDHVRGISELAATCSSAVVGFSAAFNSREFLTLAAIADDEPPETNHLSELGRVFDLPSKRLLPLSSNMVVHRFGRAVLWSLSPSPAAQARAILEMAALVPTQPGPRVKPIDRSANHCAVVLLLALDNEGFALLGSDLEESSTGWSLLLADARNPEAPAVVYKAAHHGSETAHHSGIWSGLLSPSPTTVLAPFLRGRTPVPKPADIQRLTALSGAVFSTTASKPTEPKPRNPVVDRTIRQVVRNRVAVEGRIGHVRVRRKMEPNASTRVDRFNGAVQF